MDYGSYGKRDALARNFRALMGDPKLSRSLGWASRGGRVLLSETMFRKLTGIGPPWKACLVEHAGFLAPDPWHLCVAPIAEDQMLFMAPPAEVGLASFTAREFRRRDAEDRLGLPRVPFEKFNQRVQEYVQSKGLQE